MTRTPLSKSKVKVTRPLYSPRRLRIRQLQRWAWERIHRGNLLLRCGQARSARRREALRRPQREERGRGILWRPAAQLVLSDCVVLQYLVQLSSLTCEEQVPVVRQVLCWHRLTAETADLCVVCDVQALMMSSELSTDTIINYQSVISTAADRHLHHLPYLFFPQSYCMHCHVCIVVSVQVYCKCVWLGLVSLNSAYLHLLAAVNRVRAHSV